MEVFEVLGDKAIDFPRMFGKIQTGRRIAISESIMKQLGWETGDQILIEAYCGKLIVENLSQIIKPATERFR